MPIYLEHTARLRVVIPQLVRCAHCNTEFVYELKRTGRGTAESGLVFGKRSAREAAENEARAKLREKLQDGSVCDPVPCPKCLLFQPEMRLGAADKKYGELSGCGAGSLLIGLGILGFAALAWVVGFSKPNEVLIFAGAGVIFVFSGFLIFWFVHSRLKHYDPNTMSKYARRKIARQRAMSLDAFYQKQAERIQRDYSEHILDYDLDRHPERVKGRVLRLVTDFWLTSEWFRDGMSLRFGLDGTTNITAIVPPQTTPGTVIEAVPDGASAFGFRLRLLELRRSEPQRPTFQTGHLPKADPTSKLDPSQPQ